MALDTFFNFLHCQRRGPEQQVERRFPRFLFPVLFSGVILWLTASAAAEPLKVDSVLVYKSERSLQLLSKGQVVRSYKISLGTNPIGAKSRLGDGKTPEGKYLLDYRNPKSKYYRSIHISYPNAKDRENARKLKVSPGGEVFIHGLGAGFGWVGSAQALRDWTLGCIAVTNKEMDEIWNLVSDGTAIEIRP